MTKGRVILIVAACVGVVWAAFIFEAVAARSRIPANCPADTGAAGIMRWELVCMDGDEKLTAAIFPFAGGPIYRGMHGVERERLVKQIVEIENIEATTKRAAELAKQWREEVRQSQEARAARTP